MDLNTAMNHSIFAGIRHSWTGLSGVAVLCAVLAWPGAGWAVDLDIDTVYGGPGETVNLPVKILNPAGVSIAGANLTLNFQYTPLVPQGPVTSSLFPDRAGSRTISELKLETKFRTSGVRGSSTVLQESDSLFNIPIQVPSGASLGYYLIKLEASQIVNSDAGFPNLTTLPVLMGDKNSGYASIQVASLGQAQFIVDTAPLMPTNPRPADGQSNANITDNLIWDSGDVDPSDFVSYEVYLDTVNPPVTKIVTVNVPGTLKLNIEYEPGTLAYQTQYFWKVRATDTFNRVSDGPVWTFSTGDIPTPTNTPTPTTTPTPTKTPTSTPTPTNTPTPSLTPTPTITPTKTPSPTPSLTPTTTPTPTLTPTPKPPAILLAGYWDTELTRRRGGHFTIIAATNETATAVRMYFQGLDTGVDLPGSNPIFQMDGVVGPGLTMGKTLFELAPFNSTIPGDLWPYLTVKP